MPRRLATTIRTVIAVLGALLMVVAGVAAPAQAATTRTISGTVTLGSTAVLAGAGDVQITATQIRTTATNSFTTVTQASGFYQLPVTSSTADATFRITFRYIGTGDYTGLVYPNYPIGSTSGLRGIDVTASDVGNINATLQQRATVTARVFQAPGYDPAPAGAVSVTWQRQNDADSGYGASSAPVLTDALGNYTFTGLESGYYLFRFVDVDGSHEEIPYTSPGTVIPGSILGGLVVRPDVMMYPPDTIAGTVTKFPSGALAGAGDALITWEYRAGSTGDWTPATGQSVTTDSSGRYLITGLTQPGNYRITSTWQGAGSFRSAQSIETLQTWDRSVSGVNLAMERLGSISGTVLLGAAGTPAPAGSVRVTIGVFGSAGTAVLTTAGGAYTVSGLPVGNLQPYFVKFEYLGSGPYSNPPTLQGITIGPNNDTTGVDATMPDSGFSGTVVGTDDGPLDGTLVTYYAFYRSGPHVGEYAMSVQTTTDNMGRFNFGQVPTTYVYLLQFSRVGYALQTWYNSGEWYEPDPIVFEQGEPQTGFFTTMYRSASISGSVSNLRPETLASGSVSVELLVYDGFEDEWVSAGYSELVNADGTYALTDLSPDLYRARLVVGIPGVPAIESPTIDVMEAENDVWNFAPSLTLAARISELHLALGGSGGALGAATTGIIAFPNNGGGSLQHFANGSIYATGTYGAHVVWAGAIREAYWAANSVLGSYGWPTGDEDCTSTCQQSFMGGTIKPTPLGITTAPVLSGSIAAGSKLTITSGVYSPPPTAITYRWFRDDVVIPGAIASSYTTVAADVGHTIVAEVTAKLPGRVPTVSSAATTGPITPSHATRIANLYAENGGSSGPLGVATTGIIAFPDNGGGSLQHYANGSIYSSPSGTFIVMAGPIREAYWAKNSIFGMYGWPTSAADCTSNCTQGFQGGTITAGPFTVTTPPMVSGLTVAGNLLTVSNGVYSGDAPTSFTYRWFRDGTVIASQTTNKYTTVAADAGHTFTAEVTAKGPGKVPTATISAPTPTITPTAAAEIARVYAENGGSAGALGVATTGILAFPNNGGGSLQHYTNGSIYSSNYGGTWVMMAGPIREKYWAANSIFGTYGWPSSAVDCQPTKCTQSFFTPTGTATLDAWVTSVSTPPAITGPARVGGTLTASKGTYSPTATAWTYAWYRNGVKIPGATAATYVLVADDFNKAITVEVTARSASGMPVAALSAPTSAVAQSLASEMASLATTNSVALGASTTGIVSFPDNGGGALQHFKNGSVYGSYAGGVRIVWAGPIREQYWAANSIFGAYKWPSADQDCSGAYCVQNFLGGQISAAPIANVTPPTLSGTARVGSTLTASTGTYQPTATTFSYSWWRDGTTPIAGATGASYTMVADDKGHTIVVKVTASAPSKPAVTTASAPSAVVGESFASLIASMRTSNPTLGSPTTAVVAFPDNGGGALQHYANGSIYSSNAGGTHIVWAGAIRTQYWNANSIFGSYKWPSGDRDCTTTPCTQQFVVGAISGAN